MNWTPEQEQVIWVRNRNPLVSVAAGSGETAVLVERIIQMVTDETNPVDIDELLVMTFTKAAAAEMREKIGQAVERKLTEQPGNEHLQLQSTLVHHAQITTIDSLCLNLIWDHFNVLEIDPGFRIGNEGEPMLLRKDVMERLLEDYYEKGDERFEQFVDTYVTGKAGGGIEDYIMQVYNFAQSNPWPIAWAENCRKELWKLEESHLEEIVWMEFLMEDVRKQLGGLCGQLGGTIGIRQEEGGPKVYLSTLETELAMLEGLQDAGTYEELCQGLRDVSFGRLAAARSKEIDGEKKTFVTGRRDRIKKAAAGLKENYGFEDIGEVVSDTIGTGDTVEILLELACEFTARYQESKQDKNVVDFNDLKYYALDVLVKQEDGKICYTGTADELGAQYREILVDEYHMTGGRVWGTLFFLFMSFASISTVIAVFQNIILFVTDLTRCMVKKAVVINIIAIILLSLPCALGFNVWNGFIPLGAGSNIQDLEGSIVSSNLLPIGGLIYLLFCTSRHGWGYDRFLEEANAGTGLRFPKGVKFYVSYILPLIILGIFIQGYWVKSVK